ncbi:hypothetical protein SLE2022_039120 [Rubroshorea leprosula]
MDSDQEASSAVDFEDKEHYITSFYDRIRDIKISQETAIEGFRMLEGHLRQEETAEMADLNNEAEYLVIAIEHMNKKFQSFSTQISPAGIQNLDLTEVRRMIFNQADNQLEPLMQQTLWFWRTFEEIEKRVEACLLNFQLRKTPSGSAGSGSETNTRPPPTASHVAVLLDRIDATKCNPEDIEEISSKFRSFLQKFKGLQRIQSNLPPAKSKIEATENKSEEQEIETEAATTSKHKTEQGTEGIGSSEGSLAASGDDNGEGDVSKPYAKVLDLQEQITATEQNVKKLMEELKKMEDLHKEAKDASTEFEELKKRIQESTTAFFPSGDQSLDPPMLETFQQWNLDFALELKAIDQRVKNVQESIAPSRQGTPPPPPEKEELTLSPATASKIAAMELTEAINQQVSGTNRSLSDIVIGVYGFQSSQADEIEMEVARIALNWKGQAARTSSGTGSDSTIEEMKLNWKGVGEAEKVLQCLKSENKEIHHEIPAALRFWIYCVEAQIYNLVRYLRSMMSSNEEAWERLQHLRSALGELRQSNDGMVPIMVHKIFALLETQAPEEESGFNREQQATLYRDMSFDKMIDSVHELIFHIRLTLIVSGISNAKEVSPSTLEICEQALIKAEEELKRIEERITEGRTYVPQKRKREDEEGPSGGGNGSGNLEMSEDAKGKRVRREE